MGVESIARGDVCARPRRRWIRTSLARVSRARNVFFYARVPSLWLCPARAGVCSDAERGAWNSFKDAEDTSASFDTRRVKLQV